MFIAIVDNFITYEYNNVIPSDLSSQNIIMIGRTNDRMKRFQLGVESMKYITKEIPKRKMIIISNLNYIDYLKNLVNLWELQKNVIILRFGKRYLLIILQHQKYIIRILFFHQLVNLLA